MRVCGVRGWIGVEEGREGSGPNVARTWVRNTAYISGCRDSSRKTKERRREVVSRLARRRERDWARRRSGSEVWVSMEARTEYLGLASAGAGAVPFSGPVGVEAVFS